MFMKYMKTLEMTNIVGEKYRGDGEGQENRRKGHLISHNLVNLTILPTKP